MITPVTKQEAEALSEKLQSPMEIIERFPDTDAYGTWLNKIGRVIGSKGGSSAIGVEKYKADFEFFTANCEEQLALLFLTKLAPLELVFFGSDWVISVSSYPQHEYSSSLERSVRLYGSAKMEIAS